MNSKWETVKLGDIADFQNGYPFKPKDLGSVGKPVIRIKQLMDQNVEPDRSQRDIPSRFFIGSGDIIFSWSGRIEAVLWNRGEALLNQHLYRVSRTSELFSDAFLLLSLQFLIPDLHVHGSTMKHVTKKELIASEITCPPLAEQRRIVDLIGALDVAIKVAADACAGLEKSRSHLLDSLLNNFKSTTLGELIQSIRGGKSLSAENRPPLKSEFGVLKVSAVNPLGFIPEESKTVESIEQFSDLMRVRKHDILISRANTAERVGATCFVTSDFTNLFLSDKTLRITPKEDVDLKFLVAALNSSSSKLQLQQAGTGSSASMKNISQNDIRSLKINCPTDLDSQRKIGEIDSSLLETIGESANHVESLRCLRSELLTALLSGAHEIPESYDEVMNAA